MMAATGPYPPLAPVAGQMYLNTTSGILHTFDGAIWRVAMNSVSPLPEWPTMDWACQFRSPHEVRFHDKHAVRDAFDEPVMWALLHCKGLYRFRNHLLPRSHPSEEKHSAWVWEFTDPDDAFHFKMRWL